MSTYMEQLENLRDVHVYGTARISCMHVYGTAFASGVSLRCARIWDGWNISKMCAYMERLESLACTYMERHLCLE